MKKVQNSAFKDSAYDELCERYENRARTYSKSPESAELKSREILTRATAPKSYKVLKSSLNERNKYKNGVEGNERFMTESDFANYYRANRDYTPSSNIEDDSTSSLQAIENKRYRRNTPEPQAAEKGVKNKLLREANIVNPKAAPKKAVPKKEDKSDRKKEKSGVAPSNKPRVNDAKKEKPIKKEVPKRIKEEEERKIPIGALAALGVIGISILLIIISTIILSLA